jgi:hypothetical protein
MNDPAAAENFGEVTMSSPAAKDVDRSEELDFKTDKVRAIMTRLVMVDLTPVLTNLGFSFFQSDFALTFIT